MGYLRFGIKKEDISEGGYILGLCAHYIGLSTYDKVFDEQGNIHLLLTISSCLQWKQPRGQWNLEHLSLIISSCLL